MKSTSTLVSVAALVVGLMTPACNFRAGVANGPTGAGGGTGAAGTSATGAAGTSATGAAGNSNPFAGTTGTGGMNPFDKPCEGLQCQQSTCKAGSCTVQACAGGARTTVSGTIYDPAGQVPLYNITVYVPNAALEDIKDGPSCDPCDPVTGTSLLSGRPILITKTDTSGKFTLGGPGTKYGDVPAGTNIPLVIQVGKWRREVKIPSVTPCVDNPITDKDLTRLPRKTMEGHIPKFAITTGSADALQCLLLKVGVDQSEFTPEAGTGRINLFAGGGGSSMFDATVNGGATFTPANPWWDSYDNLAKYDIVMHSCEGGQGDYNLQQRDQDIAANRMPVRGEPQSVKSPAARMALEKFANNGGRVFASHWHAYWFADGPPSFKSMATWGRNGALAQQGTIDQSFPTGMALAQWLVAVQGSTTLGMVDIVQNASNRLIDMAAGGNISQRWIYSAGQTPQSVMFLSATTPIPGGNCGRAVVSDLHVTSGMNNMMMMVGDQPTLSFPTASCVTKTLEPREKVLEFMLFDIASCVAPIIP